MGWERSSWPDLPPSIHIWHLLVTSLGFSEMQWSGCQISYIPTGLLQSENSKRWRGGNKTSLLSHSRTYSQVTDSERRDYTKVWIVRGIVYTESHLWRMSTISTFLYWLKDYDWRKKPQFAWNTQTFNPGKAQNCILRNNK